MDFSTEFVALRDKLLNGQDPHFRSQQNVQVSGRMAALLSIFNSRTPRKILGLMPTGGTSHAHEYRLLFAVPSLDEQTLDDWWKYAQQVSAELVSRTKTTIFRCFRSFLPPARLTNPCSKS